MGLKNNLILMAALFVLAAFLTGCGDDDGPFNTAYAAIKNDFNNPEMSFNPPWTICKSSYSGVEFGKLLQGETSATEAVTPGLDNVLMVLAWDDETCAPENSLPVASKNEEEVVDGQTRTIYINVPNHQGPCPPEGVQPISEELYNRILALWPAYNFKPYDQRTENTECLSD